MCHIIAMEPKRHTPDGATAFSYRNITHLPPKLLLMILEALGQHCHFDLTSKPELLSTSRTCKYLNDASDTLVFRNVTATFDVEIRWSSTTMPELAAAAMGEAAGFSRDRAKSLDWSASQEPPASRVSLPGQNLGTRIVRRSNATIDRTPDKRLRPNIAVNALGNDDFR